MIEKTQCSLNPRCKRGFSLNSEGSSDIIIRMEVNASLKRIVMILFTLLFFITAAFAESGLVFSIENTDDAKIGETIEITGMLKNVSDTDMSGMTLKVIVENSDPLITASGNDRITIRKRSDSHVMTELKPGNEIPVTIQWIVPDSINRNTFTLAVYDYEAAEIARCTIAYSVDADGTWISAAKISVLITRMIAAVGAAAVITWLIVFVRRKIRKRG